MFSDIQFDKGNYKGYTFLSPNNDKLSNLSKINIFIGQNNSGKSRFLRNMFKDAKFNFLLSKYNIVQLRKILDDSQEQLKTLFESVNALDVERILASLNDILERIKIINAESLTLLLKQTKELSDKLINLKNITSWNQKPHIYSTIQPSRIIPDLNIIGQKIKDALVNNFGEKLEFQFHKIYIPILRGLRPIQLINTGDMVDSNHNNFDNYKVRTIKDYFPKEQDLDKDIFTGLHLYEDVKHMLLGRKEEREKIKFFEDFLSENFFNNQPVSLIPDIKKDVLLIGIGNEERYVYELGDGIQSIIIMLYPLFFSRDKNLMVFIEEPENSLHPGMQRIFMEALMKPEFENFQYFITTHSNHFLDITLDYSNISVYTFNKQFQNDINDINITIENLSNENTRTLDLIGVRNSSIFLSNCSIWVEGITDRLYIRKYLEVFQDLLISKGELSRKYKEDLHYSFIEYAGANITHYCFSEVEVFEKIKASRLNNKILLIVDSDNAEIDNKTAKVKRQKQLKDNLGDNFIIVDGKEIENLLNENAIIQSIALLEKTEVSKLIYDDNKFKISEYKDQGLGSFIDNNIKGLKKVYSEESGTIKNKLSFCQKAISQINNYNDLSIPAQIMTNTILQFIKKNNS